MATLNLKNFPVPAQAVERAAPLSITELRGLGKEHWAGVDAAAHVEAERRSWG